MTREGTCRTSRHTTMARPSLRAACTMRSSRCAAVAALSRHHSCLLAAESGLHTHSPPTAGLAAASLTTLCQPQGLRAVFQNQLKTEAPPPPEPLPAAAYGTVVLTEAAALLDHLDVLSGAPVISRVPLPMEQYGQGCGWIRSACWVAYDQPCACFWYEVMPGLRARKRPAWQR